jgi:hypothetical protein
MIPNQRCGHGKKIRVSSGGGRSPERRYPMSIHADFNFHPNNMDIGNLYRPFERLSKNRILSSERPWGKAQFDKREA